MYDPVPQVYNKLVELLTTQFLTPQTVKTIDRGFRFVEDKHFVPALYPWLIVEDDTVSTPEFVRGRRVFSYDIGLRINALTFADEADIGGLIARPSTNPQNTNPGYLDLLKDIATYLDQFKTVRGFFPNQDLESGTWAMQTLRVAGIQPISNIHVRRILQSPAIGGRYLQIFVTIQERG